MFIFKSFILLSVLFFVFADDDDSAVVQNAIRAAIECLKTTGAGQPDIKHLLNKSVPTSHSGKCLVHCVLSHFNLFNEDGSLNLAAAEEAVVKFKDVDDPLFSGIIRVGPMCLERVAPVSDPCETASLLAHCAFGELKKEV